MAPQVALRGSGSGCWFGSGTEFVICDQGSGTLDLITEQGVVIPALTGLSNPRAVAADSLGNVYVSENRSSGRIRMANLEAGTEHVMADDLASPNGLALSPDEQTLYVVTGSQGDVIYSAQRSGNTFRSPEVFMELVGATAFSLATDSCGYLYAAEYTRGEIYRMSPDGTSVRQIVDLPDDCCYSGLRFGNGKGGFKRDHLYVTRRYEVYDVTVGIPGKIPIYPLK